METGSATALICTHFICDYFILLRCFLLYSFCMTVTVNETVSGKCDYKFNAYALVIYLGG